MGKAKKRVVSEAFGSASDSDNSTLHDDKHTKQKKRIRVGSDGESKAGASGSAQSSDVEGDVKKPDELQNVEEDYVRTDEDSQAAIAATNQDGGENAAGSSDDDGPTQEGRAAGGNECDFDLMLERKKAETQTTMSMRIT